MSLTKTVRTDVPPEVFTAMGVLAIETGSTVAGIARGILIGATSSTGITDKSAVALGDPDWFNAVVWLTRQRLAVPPEVPMKKSAVIKWCRENGWEG